MYDKFYAEGNRRSSTERLQSTKLVQALSEGGNFSSFAAFSKESNPRSGDGLVYNLVKCLHL